jgi:putative serine protease PepD
MKAAPRKLVVFVAAAAMGAGGAAAVLDHPAGSTTTTVTAAGSQASVATRTTSALTVGEIYSRTKQGVVEIKTNSGEGTGFVLNTNGDIVTNQHVVGGASSLQVIFSDGSRATARVLGTDASSDVAVIHVDVPASKLHPLTFADSSGVAVGDSVVAIGSPYGLAGSLTTGVISALNRTITSPSNYSISGALQTDAAINPGNSGGPLLDAAGHVIGMNAQIESSSDGNTGVGFAIASNTVRTVAEKLANGQTPQHAYLGVSLGDGSAGAAVSSVSNGGPADQAGLRSGDAIVAIDGKTIDSSDAAVAAIGAKSPGDHIKLTVLRGGQRTTLDATLGSQPASPGS